ncbi:hypothetical protein ACFFRR_011123 [Megaselia abdita]
MFKITLAIFAVIACAAAKPGLVAPLAYSAPVVAAPGVVTATSSQFVARNHNGIVAPIVAPSHFAYTAPLVHSAPLVAHTPIAKVAAPLAYSAPVAYSSPLVHSRFSSPLTYSAPLLF